LVSTHPSTAYEITVFTGRITSLKRVFFPKDPIENALSTGKGGWECTARAKYAIYDILVKLLVFWCRDCLNIRSESKANFTVMSNHIGLVFLALLAVFQSLLDSRNPALLVMTTFTRGFHARMCVA